MRKYLSLASLSFKSQIAYRADSIASLINAIVWMVVAVTVWSTLYESGGANTGIPLRNVLTYIYLVTIMNLIFTMDEFFVEKKIRRGTIAMDLIRPINFCGYVLAHMTGTAVFKLLIQGLPAFLFVLAFFSPTPPLSSLALILSIVSGIFGFLILFFINFHIWVSSFWIYQTWSFITIKDALISLLAGVVFPIWLMPQWLVTIIEFTPFSSIYHAPVGIYTGHIKTDQALADLGAQGAWLLVLILTGLVMLHIARRKLQVQGG